MLTFLSYLNEALPLLLGALAFGAAALIAAALVSKRAGRPLTAGRGLWVFVAAAYVFALLGLLLIRPARPGDFRQLSLDLFYCYREAARGFEALDMINILMNILLFLPFGFLGALAAGERRRGWLVIPLGFALSLAAEALQYLLARGIADVDDLFNNTLGVVCGWALARFCLSARAGRLRRGLASLLLALLCISPPFVTLAFSAASPYGSSEYDQRGAEALAGREISFSAEASAFLDALAEAPPAVYTVRTGTLEDAYAAADEFFGLFGLGRSAADESLYDDDAWLYSEGRSYFLRYEYAGPTLWYQRMGVRSSGGVSLSEAEAREAAAAWGVDIPAGAVMTRGEDGSYVFALEPSDGKGGSAVLRFAEDGLSEIVWRIYDLERSGSARALDEAECVSALESGAYSCRGAVPEGAIDIDSARVEYTLDSKACYRPVLFLSCGGAEFHIPLRPEA